MIDTSKRFAAENFLNQHLDHISRLVTLIRLAPWEHKGHYQKELQDICNMLPKVQRTLVLIANTPNPRPPLPTRDTPPSGAV